MSSPLRASLRILGYLLLTLPLMPVQAAAVLLGSDLARRIPRLYHRQVARIMGLDLRVEGAPSAARPTLLIANHASYLDIVVLSAVADVSFVAKAEIATWPFFAWLARLQRTVFVARRMTAVAGEKGAIEQRLAEGGNLVLFAEGTSGDGTRLLPFKSAFLSVAEAPAGGRPVTVQPVTIAYTRLDGMPLGRAWRPLVTWYGDMDMLPHMWTMLGLGRITVELRFHPTTTFAEFGSRKALTQHCEAVIGRGLSEALSGRPAPAPQPAAEPVPAR